MFTLWGKYVMHNWKNMILVRIFKNQRRLPWKGKYETATGNRVQAMENGNRLKPQATAKNGNHQTADNRQGNRLENRCKTGGRLFAVFSGWVVFPWKVTNDFSNKFLSISCLVTINSKLLFLSHGCSYSNVRIKKWQMNKSKQIQVIIGVLFYCFSFPLPRICVKANYSTWILASHWLVQVIIGVLFYCFSFPFPRICVKANYSTWILASPWVFTNNSCEIITR